MATLPRTSKLTAALAQSPFNLFYQFQQQRPVSDSDFDAGINSSTAWTEHMHMASEGGTSPLQGRLYLASSPNQFTQEGSLSDEEPDLPDRHDHPPEAGEDARYRPARTLYDFEGKAEFRELSVGAGQDIDVIKEELQDGWSLVRNVLGEIGLLPRSYYTV
jgi:sorting nexin-9/18/33